MIEQKICSLRMERQHLIRPANKEEYIALYHDLQPGQNVYWNGFGQPPTLSFRADFDDLAFNADRQRERKLLKGRFAGGNLGWIEAEELELFAALYRKPLTRPSYEQLQILELIQNAGPFTIQQIKEETGLLVKQITPLLHRLQEAFLVYEDQYDGEWDRGWYKLEELFPNVHIEKHTRAEALQTVLPRFAYRMVWFDAAMAKSFYKLPEKEIRSAIATLEAAGTLQAENGGYILQSDAALLKEYEPQAPRSAYAIHRNDVLYKANEPRLKEWIQPFIEELPYDREPLQYLLIDGEFHGASVGHFRNGPYDLNDVVCDLPDAESRKEEILRAVQNVNFGKLPQRFMGKTLEE